MTTPQSNDIVTPKTGKPQLTTSIVNFRWHSLKTRVTLTTLTIFVIGIWSLAFYTSRMLREDMQALLGEQQFSTVSYIAADIDLQFVERLRGLELLAAKISQAHRAPLKIGSGKIGRG